MKLKTCNTCAKPFTPRNPRARWCDRCEPRGRINRSPTTRAQRDGTGDYERNRRIILAGNPTCQLCRQARATTVDHRIPVARGGTHALANLVPACSSCNSRKQDSTDWQPPRSRHLPVR